MFGCIYCEWLLLYIYTGIIFSLSKVKGRRKKTANTNGDGLDWISEKERVLRLLASLLDLDLHLLWESPSAAILDEYSKYVKSMCLKSCSHDGVFNLQN